MKKLKTYFAGLGLIVIFIGLFLMVYDYPEKVYLPVMSMGLVTMLSFFYEKR